MRILAFAYSCKPGAGSEIGAGWVWSRMLARLGEAWIVTRVNNREAIEDARGRVPERDRLHFVYTDLPEWSRMWKRGKRGARVYYMLWQAAAVREARRLHRDLNFDLVWHLTMSTVWLGSLAPLLNRPFVYGPVGGGVDLPLSLCSSMGPRGLIYELGRAAARAWGRYLNPWARLSWTRAGLILVQNPDTRDWLPKRHRSRAEVFPHVVLEEVPDRDGLRPRVRAQESSGVALFAGRLLPWKGVALAIRALELLPGWKLIVCGKGTDESRLRRLAAGKPVDFLGWQPRTDLLRLMEEETDVFLFPSLHDEGGWVIVEALSVGLPVVCLDRGGPPTLGGRGVPIGSIDETLQSLAEAVRQASEETVLHPLPSLDESTERLKTLLARTLKLPVGSSN